MGLFLLQGMSHRLRMLSRMTPLVRLALRALTVAAALTLATQADAALPRGPTPSGSPGQWVTSNDYPSAALRNEVEGVVGFLLTIGVDGVPSGCEVAQSSASPDLDNQTCLLLMQRARFTPGTDGNGKPAASTYRSSVRWQIPRDIHVEAALFTYSYVVQADGTVSDCKVVRTNGAAAGYGNVAGDGPCGRLGQHLAPYLDPTGKPVARRVTTTYSVTVEAP
ncbi:energy transducer TonB [Novosphingobium sp.]|uniref:energy transducer TonB n=1 Tax=Novosphingobium sp. TaxID=1874826 RepID=UPI0038B9E881